MVVGTREVRVALTGRGLTLSCVTRTRYMMGASMSCRVLQVSIKARLSDRADDSTIWNQVSRGRPRAASLTRENTGAIVSLQLCQYECQEVIAKTYLLSRTAEDFGTLLWTVQTRQRFNTVACSYHIESRLSAC